VSGSAVIFLLSAKSAWTSRPLGVLSAGQGPIAGQCRARRSRPVARPSGALCGGGIDQVMFIQQSGTNRHEHICESFEVFAERVMPEFKPRGEVRQAEKRRELMPISRPPWRAGRRWRRLTMPRSRASKPSGARRPRNSSIPTAAMPSRSRLRILSPLVQARDPATQPFSSPVPRKSLGRAANF
jgi:hypothetical protein